jgi:hypothetical protein
LRKIDYFLQVLDAVVNDAHQARGEARVAAGFFFRGSFEHEHALCPLRGGNGCAKRGVAAADDYDVVGHRSQN